MAQVNKLRDLISEGRLKISQNCKNLIYQLSSGQWAKKDGKLEFAHLDESLDGELPANHLDLIDCLIYMVRNIDLKKNPKDSQDIQEYIGAGQMKRVSKKVELMKKMFNRRK